MRSYAYFTVNVLYYVIFGYGDADAVFEYEYKSVFDLTVVNVRHGRDFAIRIKRCGMRWNQSSVTVFIERFNDVTVLFAERGSVIFVIIRCGLNR